MITRSNRLTVLLCSVLVCWSLGAGADYTHAGFVFTSAADFDSGMPPTYPYSTTLNFKADDGSHDLTVTVVDGENMRRHYRYEDSPFPVLNNPALVGGKRINRFWPDGNNDAASPPRTARYQMDFAIPMEAGDMILMFDFDNYEEVSITAFGPSNQQLDLTGWTTETGQGHDTRAITHPTWELQSGGSVGRLYATLYQDRTEPLFALYPDSPIKRLVFDFYLPTIGDVDFALGAWQVTPPEPPDPNLVPEPATLTFWGLGGFLGLVFMVRRWTAR